MRYEAPILSREERAQAGAWRARLLAALILLLGSAGVAADDVAVSVPPGTDFGAGLTLQSLAELSEVVAEPERFSGRPVLMAGRISDVCQHKGCWTVLSQGETHVRVRFKDYGFFLPRDCSGKQAFVEGAVEVAEVTAKDAGHYAGESKHPEAEKLHSPGKQVTFVATGVRLIGYE
jgi:hypothetical protein